LVLLLVTVAQAKEKAPASQPVSRWIQPWAIMVTSKGGIVIKLFERRATKTVENFIGLATGSKAWKNPKTGKMERGKPFYNGLIFHRVIPNFMIQGGCPLGTGTGGPGYKFADEFHPQLRHDGPGILSMANSGPNTNGSQFFITLKATPWLNGRKMKVCSFFRRPAPCRSDRHCQRYMRRYPFLVKPGGTPRCNKTVMKGHSVFGKVIHGQDVVKAIGNVSTGARNKPKKPVYLHKVLIRRADQWKKEWLQLK